MYKSSFIKFAFLVLTVTGIIIGLPYGIHVVSWMIVLAGIIHAILMVQLSINLMQTSWGSFLKTLIPGIKLMVILGAKNWLVIHFLSEYITGALLVLIVNFMMDLVIIFVILRINRTIFGRENLMFLVKIINNINYIKPKYKDKIIAYLKC